MNKPIRACGRDEAQTAETGGEPAFTCLPCPAPAAPASESKFGIAPSLLETSILSVHPPIYAN